MLMVKSQLNHPLDQGLVWLGTPWEINIDPENHIFLMETSLPLFARVYVNLPEGK